MLQEFVDDVLAVTKESVKTFTYESLNNIARLINGLSALLLSLLPGKSKILEGIHGWELRPKFQGPRLPRWMENGVSSFNEFIHEFSADSDTDSIEDSAFGDDYSEDDACPPSPMSQTSHLSHASSMPKRGRRFVRLTRLMLSWILWPTSILLSILLFPFNFRTIPSKEHGTVNLLAPRARKRSGPLKDQLLQRAIDRRRGVFEDLQLGTEIFIESIFDGVHKAAHVVLSPSQVREKFLQCFFRKRVSGNGSVPEVTVPTATIGSTDPAPTETKTSFRHSLNTDSRTCEDVIRELGYPYEAIEVVTSDGYVLLLERIPRCDSRKVVYLQHGIMDSSMGWVSNGVVGSPAFAAYDQGYDVFLGNLRGLVSREHTDKTISRRRYWGYSVNEHGTKDIPAIIEEIHKIKTSELAITKPLDEMENNNTDDDETQICVAETSEYGSVDNGENSQPYRLCAICHSLGGAVMLMYVIMSRLANKPHRLSRLILLSPAGFHEDSTIAFDIVEKMVLFLGPLLAPVVPGLYIPTRFFRMLLNKLARDFSNYPALGGLVQTLMSYLVGGDSSNWVGVLGLPHYNMDDMPGVSFLVAIHLAQMKRARRFQMYDYGRASANMEVYGTPGPLDLGACYDLIDIPVDLVAGHKDKVIPSSMVKKHLKLMRKAGVDVTFKEFEYAHLDFTFSHREELLSHVMSRLSLVGEHHGQQLGSDAQRDQIGSPLSEVGAVDGFEQDETDELSDERGGSISKVDTDPKLSAGKGPSIDEGDDTIEQVRVGEAKPDGPSG